MISCDNVIERSRNTYLFKSNLRRLIVFFNRVVEFTSTSCYLSADRDDGKIYLNVEYEFDNFEVEKYIKDWIQFNSELVDCFHFEYVSCEYEKRAVIRLK